jgi:hypothetical protein
MKTEKKAHTLNDFYEAQDGLSPAIKRLNSIGETAAAVELKDCLLGIGENFLDSVPNFKDIPNLVSYFLEHKGNLLQPTEREAVKYYGEVTQSYWDSLPKYGKLPEYPLQVEVKKVNLITRRRLFHLGHEDLYMEYRDIMGTIKDPVALVEWKKKIESYISPEESKTIDHFIKVYQDFKAQNK